MVFPILGSGSAAAAYDIENSCRFEGDEDSKLVYTPSSTSSDANKRKYTISLWFKRSEFVREQGLFNWGKHTNSDDMTIFFQADAATDEYLRIYDYGNDFGGDADYNWRRYPTYKFRDPSAWYHLVVRVDTTDGTAGNRVKIYINGVQQTSFSASADPDQNYAGYCGAADTCDIGSNVRNTDRYFSGYKADVAYVDGTAYAASDFGEFDDDSGIWKPKKPSVTWGSNGFFLEFQNGRKSILGTSTASISTTGGWYSSYSVAATLIDGDFTTYVQSNNTAQTATFKFDLGSGITKIVTSYLIDWGQTAGVSQVVLSGSNDDSSYTTIDTNTSLTTTGSGTVNEYQTVTNSTAYRYYKLAYTQNNSDYPYVQQVEMYTTNTDGLGNDTSGNGNDLLPDNMAAVTDQCTDTPTNNFATLRIARAPASSGAVLTQGNLKFVTGNSGGARNLGRSVYGTIPVNKGKWYFETKIGIVNLIIGVAPDEGANIAASTTDNARFVGYYPPGNGTIGQIYTKLQSTESYPTYGNQSSVNDVLGFAVDMDNKLIYVRNSGGWAVDSGYWDEANPNESSSLNFNNDDTHLPGYVVPWASSSAGATSSTIEWNFGSPPFAISSGNADANGYGNFEYAVPSGYYSMCTKNLAEYG